ncbi:tyrosine-protein phosphatase [Mycobacterium sp. GA-2829]|uniref:tyrosine-protein phosphatase n=1 Tax=Mycobacterium sp. GA-2829 TaxID=1772283 RepID=UPI00074026C4|nr:tyrosine-protein phosphatase [Mycobacterium sp. GA-2829]KUI29203.1 phosphotyrosine protein phosphatase [Mycobacterium sp. GA-2829]
MPSTGSELSGAWNFRDVAEQTGIAPGVFYRASELSRLDDDGRAALTGYGVTDVADLRSDREVARRGAGQVPHGVDIHRLPFREVGAHAPHEQGFEQILAENTEGAEDIAAAAARYMTEEYRKYPVMAGAQAAVRQAIALIADQRTVLTHCFAGKDRTGFTIAVVLEAAGIDRDAIMADYLRSNDAVPLLREQILESIRARAAAQTDEIVTFAEANFADEVLGVRESYLDAARDVIDDEYGSMKTYLDAIGVTSDQIRRLRARLR